MKVVWICYAAALITIVASARRDVHIKKPPRCKEIRNPPSASLTETDEAGRLFLNTFIENCSIADGRQKSEVKFFKEQFGVEAYSGYITVDYPDRKNLFFFLVKSKENNKGVPLILWLNGGPGQTSLFGQFVENGPVGISEDGTLCSRSVTLNNNFDVLYLDQPVGAGFSFTKNETHGYPKSLEDIANDIEKFLRFFFRLFKEYNNIDLYIAGESYGVRAAAAAAAHIQKIRRDDKLPANLKGVMCGVGLFTDTLRQVDTSDLLLNLGLVDHHGYKELTGNIQKMKNLVATKDQKNISLALGLYMQTFGSTTNFSAPKFRLRRTGFLYNGNAVKPTKPEEHVRFVELMKNTTFREQIHAGERASFREKDAILMKNLIKDLYRSIDKEFELLLNDSIKILVFVGQLDLKVSNVVTEKFLRDLCWTGVEEFNKAEQKPWWGKAEDKDFAGYFTKAKGLTLVKLLTSGHYPFFDQPQASNEMMRKFINDEGFITKTVDKDGVYQKKNGV